MELLIAFKVLKKAGDFRKHHLPYVKSLVDLDLIREIGFGQVMERPLSLKQLFLHGIASVATVQRRLAHLKRIGIVEQSKAEHDRRVVKLTLSAATLKTYRRWTREVQKVWEEAAAPVVACQPERRSDERRISARSAAMRASRERRA